MSYKEKDIVVLIDDCFDMHQKGTLFQVSRVLGEVVWFVTNYKLPIFCNVSRIRKATKAEEFLYKENYNKTRAVIMKPINRNNEESQK